MRSFYLLYYFYKDSKVREEVLSIPSADESSIHKQLQYKGPLHIVSTVSICELSITVAPGHLLLYNVVLSV